MAIDTANKRSSAINVSSPWRSRLPFPDGTIDQGDRQHAAYMYSGIEAGEPEEVVLPRVLYRPQSATGPSAYRPLSTALPPAYRPENSTPAAH